MGHEIHSRYLALKRFCVLLRAAELIPILVYGYGFVPGKLVRMLGPELAMNIEKLLAKSSVLQRFGVHQLVVRKER